MKYVIVRCEDAAPSSEKPPSLLEGAKMVYLQELAQGGAGGMIRSPVRPKFSDRFQAHRALLGLSPHDPEGTAGGSYAASIGVQTEIAETIWCCDFVTHSGGTLIDPEAGNIHTNESRALIQALNEQFGSETQRWEVGEGSHHILLVRDSALRATWRSSVPSPEYIRDRLWHRVLPRGILGQTLRLLIEQTSKMLETHQINRVRIDLGENPANMLWFWGASRGARRTFKDRTGFSGAVVSGEFALRGFAQLLGLDWQGSGASNSEAAIKRRLQSVEALLRRNDLVYVHIKVVSAEPVERLCVMERVDQLLLQPLVNLLPAHGEWRLMCVVDEIHNNAMPFVAIGTGLPRSPIARLSTEQLRESPLSLEQGRQVFSWLTGGH